LSGLSGVGEGGAAARRAPGLHGEREGMESRMRGLGDATRTGATGLRRASEAAAAAAAATGVAAASLVAVAVPAGMGLRTAVREWAEEAGRAADEGRAVLVGCFGFVLPAAAAARAGAAPVRCPPLPAAAVAAAAFVVVFFFPPPRGAA